MLYVFIWGFLRNNFVILHLAVDIHVGMSVLLEQTPLAKFIWTFIWDFSGMFSIFLHKSCEATDGTISLFFVIVSANSQGNNKQQISLVHIDYLVSWRY